LVEVKPICTIVIVSQPRRAVYSPPEPEAAKMGKVDAVA
jgi:hypothetical protein